MFSVCLSIISPFELDVGDGEGERVGINEGGRVDGVKWAVVGLAVGWTEDGAVVGLAVGWVDDGAVVMIWFGYRNCNTHVTVRQLPLHTICFSTVPHMMSSEVEAVRVTVQSPRPIHSNMGTDGYIQMSTDGYIQMGILRWIYSGGYTQVGTDGYI